MKKSFLLLFMNHKWFRIAFYVFMIILDFVAFFMLVGILLNDPMFSNHFCLGIANPIIQTVISWVFVLIVILFQGAVYLNDSIDKAMRKLPEWSKQKIEELGLTDSEFNPLFNLLLKELEETGETAKLNAAIEIIQKTKEAENKLLSALDSLNKFEADLKITTDFRRRLNMITRG
jgi:hypothetical protein